MSISTKEVTYCTEVDTLLGLVTTAIVAVKAGKSAGDIVKDLVPEFVAALAGLGDLKTELSDRKDLETTIALKLAELTNSLVG